MDNYTPAFKARLGIFIAVGLSIFVIIIFFIGKQQNLFNPVFKVTTNFQNVSGLVVGNNVSYSGINVGIVDDITILNDSTVQVTALIRRNVQQFIKSDSEARIGSDGIIGDRILTITQGSTRAGIVEDNERLRSIEPIETDMIIASLQTSASSAEIITNQLSQILTNINSGEGTVGRLIKDESIANNIAQTIDNFEKSSREFDETIEVTKQNVFEFMERLQVTAAKTEIASQELGEIMMKINRGEGTIGALINDTTMSSNLNQTIINLMQSSLGLDENMQALRENFFFRGYFRRLEREENKRLEEKEKLEQEQEIEANRRRNE
ncbi:MAG: MlaD family protein [Balneolales bacterium]|nr:MlaD family protein [Balneolales bacterium]